MKSLNLQAITGEVNWGDTVNLIKTEGFYMFGGRRENNEASDDLLIFQVREDYGLERAAFTVVKPETSGKPPPARYMHTMDYVAASNIVVVYGGRNDFSAGTVLSDLWVLRLCDLEWIEAKVGGPHLPIARCNHTSVVNGTELVICGGQTHNFGLHKDMITIELDQSQIRRTNPIMGVLAAKVHARLVTHTRAANVKNYYRQEREAQAKAGPKQIN